MLAANIRGVGQYDFNPALEPGVGLYVDDVYYATLTGSIFDLLDLDRVEILRGPQGTLSGRNSIAYQGMLHTNAINRESNKIPGYALADARLIWRNAGKDLEVSVEVTNLFDEYYYLTINDQTTGGQGYANAQPARPREWALSVKKKF